MSKVIYRVYDIYCTGDSYLYTESKEIADTFCANLNKKTPIGTCKVEEIIMEVPYWEEDLDCMPMQEMKRLI